MESIRSRNLDDLIQQVKERLKELSYSEHARKSYNIYFNNIRKYAVSKGITEFTEQLGADFLKERYNYPFRPTGRLCTTIQNASRSVELLSSFQKNGEISRRKKRRSKLQVENNVFQKTMDSYADSIRFNYQNQNTVDAHTNTVHDFLNCLSAQGLKDLTGLNANHVSGFIKTLIQKTRGSRKAKLTHIRFFLRFLYAQNHTKIDLSLAIPLLRLGGHTYVPEPFTLAETESFLSAIDRTKAHGKRDYAIVQMISQLGIRSGDVRQLKFVHINWETSTISFEQEKTRQLIELPMPEDVGLSVIDYIQNGRPQSDSEYVFIRHSAPFGPMAGLTDICRRYIQKSEKETKRNKGLHAFRHTLASRLLEEDVPTQAIAQILGHVNNNTVGEYLHIDFKRLRLCALDPEEVFVNE